jgi:hypothetical protein
MIEAPFLVVKLVTLVLSLAVAYLAYHGYRRTESDPMRYVSVGFVFIGVGAVCEGLVYRLFDTSFLSAAVVQGVVVSSGLLFVLASLTLGDD